MCYVRCTCDVSSYMWKTNNKQLIIFCYPMRWLLLSTSTIKKKQTETIAEHRAVRGITTQCSYIYDVTSVTPENRTTNFLPINFIGYPPKAQALTFLRDFQHDGVASCIGYGMITARVTALETDSKQLALLHVWWKKIVFNWFDQGLSIGCRINALMQCSATAQGWQSNPSASRLGNAVIKCMHFL